MPPRHLPEEMKTSQTVARRSEKKLCGKSVGKAILTFLMLLTFKMIKSKITLRAPF